MSKSTILVLCLATIFLAIISIDKASANTLHRRSRIGANWRQTDDDSERALESTPNDRRSRLLNLFFIVRFANERCNASSGLAGTCYTSAQCASRGGNADGTCAQNYGVCCTFVLQTCGNSSSENCTYFQNPGFSNTYNMAQTCSIFISKRDSNICQVKLDFLTFNVQPPTDGTCTNDRFTISGQNGNSVFPPLCGDNTGQTAYADVSSSQGPIILSLTTAGSFARSWNIKVTQIRCNDPNLAPANCLQYFTGASGTLRSFNYATTGPAANLGYFNNLRYSICIRKEMGFCDITFSNPAGSTFGIDTTGPADGDAGAGMTECDNDYILLGDLRLCGDVLNPDLGATNPTVDANVPVTTNGPFVVDVVSDATVVRRGFMIDYTQMACMGK